MRLDLLSRLTSVSRFYPVFEIILFSMRHDGSQIGPSRFCIFLGVYRLSSQERVGCQHPDDSKRHIDRVTALQKKQDLKKSSFLCFRNAGVMFDAKHPQREYTLVPIRLSRTHHVCKEGDQTVRNPSSSS